MNTKNPNGGMDLSGGKGSQNQDSAPSQIAEIDIWLESLVTLQAIAGGLEACSIELSDIKDNYNRQLLSQGILKEDDIIKREKEALAKKPAKKGPKSQMNDIPEILEDLAEFMDGMAVNLEDLKDNSNRAALNAGILSEIDIEEREQEDGEN